MYVDTEMIYDEAAKEDLRVVFDDTGSLYGCLVENYIILNYILKNNETLLRCVLAEEIGHKKYSPANFYTLDSSYMGRIMDRKLEAAALRWAASFLIPDQYEFITLYDMYAVDSFQAAIYELCEYYKVIPQFIELRRRMIKV